jgi:hypothetical protein
MTEESTICYRLPLQTILDNSSSAYAQVLASSSLIKIVTEHSLGTQVKLEMRSYFLNYLDRCGAAAPLPGNDGAACEPCIVRLTLQFSCGLGAHAGRHSLLCA